MKIWFRKLIAAMIEIVVLFIATAVLAGILLSFIEALWYIYLQTPVGLKYTANPSRSSVHLLTQLIEKDIFLLSVDIAIAAMAACLMVSAVCQVLAFRRYFYEGRSLLNRVIWLVLFGAAGAHILEHNSHIDFQLAFGVVIAPCLCLFSICQNIAERLLPELTPAVIIQMISGIRSARNHAKNRNVADSNPSLYPPGRNRLQPALDAKAALSVKPPRARSDSSKVPG